MGLLEQLEQEAETQRLDAARALADQRRRAQLWSEQMLPAMRSLDLYLQRLVAELGRRKPTARLRALLPGYGNVVAYLDHRYTLRSTPDDDSYEIALSTAAEVASDECPLVLAEGIDAVTTVAGALWSQRLFGLQHANLDADGEARAARFQARGRIPMSLRVHADRASGVARMVFVNIGGFGQYTRTFTAAQLTPSKFESLGRLIAQVDRSFLGEPPAERTERRQRARRRDAIRPQGTSPGRRKEDIVASARLRPWRESGAWPTG